MSSTLEFQHYCADIDMMTSSNATIIPLPLLRIILMTDDQSPAGIAIKLLNEMKCLDSIWQATAKPYRFPSKQLQDLDITSTSSSPESYIDNCGCIIQWLYLMTSNRIKLIRCSIARDNSILFWFKNSYSEIHNLNSHKNSCDVLKRNYQPSSSILLPPFCHQPKQALKPSTETSSNSQ